MSTLLTNQIQNLAGGVILRSSGSIIQVQSTILQTTFTTSTIITTSGGGAAVSGLSASITPSSATSKILVTCSLNIMGQSGSTQSFAYLARGTTPIGTGTGAGSRPGMGGRYYYPDSNVSGMIWMQFLDNPLTTNVLTYNVYVGTENASYTVYVNRTQSDSDALNGARTSSVLTLMEVAA
jgi:hypothetical protein